LCPEKVNLFTFERGLEEVEYILMSVCMILKYETCTDHVMVKIPLLATTKF